jgi:predicted RND superfamily exporter protein
MRAQRYIDFVQKHARKILFFALLLVVGAVPLVSRLTLKAQFSELLPVNDPAVVELNKLTARIGASSNFMLLLESPEPSKNRTLADAIVANLKQHPKGTWSLISYETSQEQAFFEKYAPLYANLEDLVAFKEALKLQIDTAKTGSVSFEEEDPTQLFAALQAKYQQKFQQMLLFPTGYFEGGVGHNKLVIVLRPGTEGLGGEETAKIYAMVDEAVKGAQRSLGSSYASVDVAYSGDIPAVLFESQAIKEDLSVAALACILLVCLAIGLYFRQARSVFFVATPALLGTLFAFGFAYLTIGYLNSNTAFLGSIILGNGINYAIIFLARYREERLHGKELNPALARAISFTWKPSLAAATGASIAYGSLLVTTFRGFNQFGFVGCIGMILCWSLTFTVLPALIFEVERLRPSVMVASPKVSWIGERFGALARAVAYRPVFCLAAVAVLFVASLYPISKLAQDPFEYDFVKLRNEKALTQGPSVHVPEIVEIFGKSLTPAILAANSPEEALEARQKIYEKDDAITSQPNERSCVGQIDTLSDYLPAQQSEKLVVLAQIKAMLDDDALALAKPEDQKHLQEARQRLAAFFPNNTPKALTLYDLPENVAAPYTERDGTRGAIVQIQRGQGVSAWNGRDLICFANATRNIELDNGSIVSSTGTGAVFTDMLKAVLHDGPLATLAELSAVALLVFFTFRKLGPWVLVMLTLFVGVTMMLGLAAAFGMRLNFLNFVSIPITFGIASEYGINLVERARQEGAVRLIDAIRGTGGAVSLCSLTTIIGYGTLMLSDNQALQSFGKLAGLGEITTLLCAMIIVPAMFSIRATLEEKQRQLEISMSEESYRFTK